MIKKYCRQHIGEKFLTKEQCRVVVIDGGVKNKYCTIKFLEYNYIKEVNYPALKKGEIKNNLFISKYNKGFIGIGNYKTSENGIQTKAYGRWSLILMRCYDKNYHKQNTSYINCIVDNKWLNYQKFAKWFYKNYKVGFEIDKDLLVQNNKIYSETTCIFLPQRVNQFLSNKLKNNTSGYTGVNFNKNYKKWHAKINDFKTGKRIHLGYFINIIDAANAYGKARKNQIKNVSKYMYDLGFKKEIINKLR